MSEELDILVYIPQYYCDYSKEWCNATNKAGNGLYKTKGQALKKLRSDWRISSKSKTKVVEYKLIPTGKVFNNE